MKTNYMILDGSLVVTIVENGKSKVYNMDSSHQNWDTVIQKLSSEDYEGIEALFSVKKAVEEYVSQVSDSGVEVTDYGVKYNGVLIDNYLTRKIVDFSAKKLPVKPLLLFFEKVMKNPSRRAVNELYKFLEHGQMPITPDGNFLGYKSVRQNYKDWYSNTFDNSVGQTLEMPRNQVCDDPEMGCSYGFHVGTLEYAKGLDPNNRVMIVEVDPSNVVSVPHDCNHQKLRTSKYVVVGKFEMPLDNDYSNQYTGRTIKDVENEIEDVKCRLRNSNNDMSSEDLMDIAQELKDLEGELGELEFNKFTKENATTSSTNEPCRDSKGRFCKKTT